MRRLALNEELHAPSDKPNITDSMTDLVELDELSEADVKHDRCPICKQNPLEKQEGFKFCPRCQTMFKMLDGQGYMVGDGKPQPFQFDDYRGGLPIMSNRIISRMKMAEAVEPLQQPIGDKFVAAFNAISKDQLQKWADEAVDNVITDEDYIAMASESHDGADSVTEENIIEDNLEYIEDYLWDSVVNSKEFEGLNTPALGNMDAQISSTIKELAQSSGTKAGWKKFEKLLSERVNDEEGWEAENRDTWRGTGMSQSDFI